MTKGCVMTLTKCHSGKVEVTGRKSAEFVSGLQLFEQKHQQFLIHTKIANDLNVWHDLDSRSFGQVQQHCLKNDQRMKFDTKLACVRAHKINCQIIIPACPSENGPLMYLSSFLKKKIVWKIFFGKKIGHGIPKIQNKNIKWQNFNKK